MGGGGGWNFQIKHKVTLEWPLRKLYRHLIQLDSCCSLSSDVSHEVWIPAPVRHGDRRTAHGRRTRQSDRDFPAIRTATGQRKTRQTYVTEDAVSAVWRGGHKGE